MSKAFSALLFWEPEVKEPEQPEGLTAGPLFSVAYSSSTESTTATWLGSNKNTHVHPILLDFFAELCKEGDHFDPNIDLLCYTEYVLSKNGKTFPLRSHPNYRGDGHWFDFVMVRFEWEADSGSVLPSFNDFPAKILCLFRGTPTEDDPSPVMAVVHPCTYITTQGKRGSLATTEEQRIKKTWKTHLCERWCLETKAHPTKGGDWEAPKLYAVPVASILHPIFAVEETPGLLEATETPLYCWVAKDRRSQWSNMFPLPNS
jgi:hypothetical protein